MMMSTDPKETARHRSKLYFESELEKAQGVMKNEVAEKNGWMRSSFEAGYLDAAIPLEAHLGSQEARYEAEIEMLKRLLHLEQEARVRAQEEAHTLKQFPMFVLFPLKGGGSTYIRIDQISAITDSKVYLVGDSVPFTDLEDPKKAFDGMLVEVTQLIKKQHEAHTRMRPQRPRPNKYEETEEPVIRIPETGAMNFGHD